MDEFGKPLTMNNDFALLDFVDNPNFDQFIDLIGGENHENRVPNFDCRLISGCCVDDQFGSTSIPDDMFDLNASTMVSDPNFVLNSSFSSLNGESKGGNGEEENDGDDSSGSTRTTRRKSKVDRSRTLTTERWRRGRMKEKLYALRALVPNITKMDKASIVGDAVLYVQELQTKAKKLKSEIAGLEASLEGTERYQETIENYLKKTQLRSCNHPICKKITQMDVLQVEERGFYLRLVCNRGQGVATSLYRALESLTSFKVSNSNLATVSERFVLTFTLNVSDNDQSMHLPNLKLWVTSALLNQGFEVLTPLPT